MKLAGFQIDFTFVQIAILIIGNILLYQYTAEVWWCLTFSAFVVIALNAIPYTRGSYLPGVPIHWWERITLESVDESNEPYDIEWQDWQVVPNFLSLINRVFKTDEIAKSVLIKVANAEKETSASAESPSDQTKLLKNIEKTATDQGLNLNENADVDLVIARRLDSPTPWRATLAAVIKRDKTKRLEDFLTSPEGLFLFRTRRMRGPHVWQAEFGSQNSTSPTDLTFQTPDGSLSCAEALIVIPPEPAPVPTEVVTALKLNAQNMSLLNVILELIKDRWSDHNRLIQADADRQQNKALSDALTVATGEKFLLGQAVMNSRPMDVEEMLDEKHMPIPHRGFLSIPPTTLIMAVCALLGAVVGSLQAVYTALGYTQIEAMLAGGILGAIAGWFVTKIVGVGQ